MEPSGIEYMEMDKESSVMKAMKPIPYKNKL
jgi:hypothetical protein